MTRALRFPGADALAVALQTGLLPAATRATTWRDGPAILLLVPDLPDETLARLGVTLVDAPPGGRVIASLFEALPLLPAPITTDEVLFVDPPEGIVALAGELVRLGCDRLSLAPSARAVRCRDAPEWIMARVVPGDPSPLRAFAPAGPSLWVAAGWGLPHAATVETPGTLVLVEADGDRRALPDGPWLDAADVAEILTPDAPPPLEPVSPPRLTLRLRLVASRRAARPRLWVVPESRFAALDDLVATLDEATLDALHFAVARRGPSRWAILRARGDVDLDLGTPYAPLPEADSLHIPVGMTLAPRIWPSRLRAALTPRPDEVVWLVPHEASFLVERLPDVAFVPLADWVDFILDEAAPALEPWVRSVTVSASAPVSVPVPVPVPGSGSGSVPASAPVLRPRIAPPSARRPHRGADATLATIERRLLELLDTAPDSPDLPPLWRELAHLHPDPREAALAWGCSVWHLGDPSLAAAELLEQRADLDAARRRAVAAIAARAAPPADDAELDVRTAWLAHLAAPWPILARARDRWLDRLRSGLALARDVPSLLRRSGSAPSADARARTEALTELHDFLLAAPRPENPLEAPWPLTAAYLRLTLAHGFALLGDHERAAVLAETAAAELPADPVHDAAQGLYRARRDELVRAEEAPPVAAEAPILEAPILRYKLDRLRAASTFLAGVEWIDPVTAFRSDPTRSSEPTTDLGRLACLAAWEGRLAEADVLAARLAASAVADPELRRTAARGRALAGAARGLARQGLSPPASFSALVDRAGDDLAGLVLVLPLAGVLGDRRLLARAEALYDAAATEERLVLGQALAGFAAAAAPADEARRIALRLAAQAPDVTDVLSTNSHFCLSLLRLAEAATSALARDGTPGARQRARLDEDERRVRRRIHRDFAALAPEEQP